MLLKTLPLLLCTAVLASAASRTETRTEALPMGARRSRSDAATVSYRPVCYRIVPYQSRRDACAALGGCAAHRLLTAARRRPSAGEGRVRLLAALWPAWWG